MANPVNFDVTQSLIQNGGVPGAPNTLTPPIAPGTYVTPDQNNLYGRGVKVTVDVTIPNGGSITVTIQGKDPVSGKYYTILASTAIVAASTVVLTVYPGIAIAANSAASDILPATWRIQVVIATAAVTATVGASVNV